MMYIDNIRHAFEKRRKRNIERKNDRLCKQLSERVQVKEYDNKMYVAIDGTPMIDAASLYVDIITALQSIRETISRILSNNEEDVLFSA